MWSNVIFCNHAATSWPKPETVYRAADQALRQGGNPHRGGHGLELGAAYTVESARERVAQFLGIADPGRLVWAFNATDALNMALQGLLGPGDRVLITPWEHNSVLRPLEVLRQNRGITVEEFPVDGELDLDLEVARQMLATPARLAVINHASNVTGQVQPVEELARLARARGTAVLVDAAQTAGSLPLAVEDLGADLLAFTGHKGLLGPPGTGGLYVAPGLELNPWRTGGTGNRSDRETPPETMPERLEAGTQNVAGLAGLEAGVAFLQEVGADRVAEHEANLVQRLLKAIAGIRAVEVVGPPAGSRRVGVVSVQVQGLDPGLLEQRLATEWNIVCRSGLHCAPRAHRASGTFPGGTVRLSVGWFNKLGEMDRVAEALQCLAAQA